MAICQQIKMSQNQVATLGTQKIHTILSHFSHLRYAPKNFHASSCRIMSTGRMLTWIPVSKIYSPYITHIGAYKSGDTGYSIYTWEYPQEVHFKIKDGFFIPYEFFCTLCQLYPMRTIYSPYITYIGAYISGDTGYSIYTWEYPQEVHFKIKDGFLFHMSSLYSLSTVPRSNTWFWNPH